MLKIQPKTCKLNFDWQIKNFVLIYGSIWNNVVKMNILPQKKPAFDIFCKTKRYTELHYY